MAYVMIVDDDEDFASAAGTLLEASEHEVKIVLEAENCIRHMEERKPDIVILDVMFPEDSNAGFELARQIKHHRGDLKDVPVLMLTAVNESPSIQFSAGDIDDTWQPVKDFLEKPVDLDVLRNRVNSMLEGAKAD